MTLCHSLNRHTLVLGGLLGVALTPRLGRAEIDNGSGVSKPPGNDAMALASTPAGSSADLRSHQQASDTPVDVVCKAAVALALAEPERARGFVSRARTAGWLPEVRFRVYRRFARTEGLTFDDTGTGVVSPVDISAVDDVRYEWRATWDLSRMVFNPDELQAHFEALRMSDVRRDIQSLVIKLYFERRRLIDERSASGGPATGGALTDAHAAERSNLRILELEAQLDALSGGAFSGDTDPRSERKGMAHP